MLGLFAVMNLAAVGGLAGCVATDSPATASSASPTGVSATQDRGVTRPRQVEGDRLKLAESGCDTPPATVYVVNIPVRKDGTTGAVSFPQAVPDACIAAYIRGKVASSRYEPGTVDGEPADLNLVTTVSSPR